VWGCGLAATPAAGAPKLAPEADPGWIRVRVDGRPDRATLFRPDGTGRTEVSAHPRVGQPSPDGKSTVYVEVSGEDHRVSAIWVADTDGKNARNVSPETGTDFASPAWSPDGRRIVFIGVAGGRQQVHVMDRDGKNVRQVTDLPANAWDPAFGADGRLAYLTVAKDDGKGRRTELVVSNGKEAVTVAQPPFITAYAWSPDGKSLAYAKPGALVFHDLGSGDRREVRLTDVDERLSDHGVTRIGWRPDGRAVACSIRILGIAHMGPGPQPATSPKMFGDTELFVIPRAGKPSWFEVGAKVAHFDWLKDR
jgi:dipeptidyl aminopeptidase/acylaminoacyl peptidase